MSDFTINRGNQAPSSSGQIDDTLKEALKSAVMSGDSLGSIREANQALMDSYEELIDSLTQTEEGFKALHTLVEKGNRELDLQAKRRKLERQADEAVRNFRIKEAKQLKELQDARDQGEKKSKEALSKWNRRLESPLTMVDDAFKWLAGKSALKKAQKEQAEKAEADAILKNAALREYEYEEGMKRLQGETNQQKKALEGKDLTVDTLNLKVTSKVEFEGPVHANIYDATVAMPSDLGVVMGQSLAQALTPLLAGGESSGSMRNVTPIPSGPQRLSGPVTLMIEGPTDIEGSALANVDGGSPKNSNPSSSSDSMGEDYYEADYQVVDKGEGDTGASSGTAFGNDSRELDDNGKPGGAGLTGGMPTSTSANGAAFDHFFPAALKLLEHPKSSPLGMFLMELSGVKGGSSGHKDGDSGSPGALMAAIIVAGIVAAIFILKDGLVAILQAVAFAITVIAELVKELTPAIVAFAWLAVKLFTAIEPYLAQFLIALLRFATYFVDTIGPSLAQLVKSFLNFMVSFVDQVGPPLIALVKAIVSGDAAFITKFISGIVEGVIGAVAHVVSDVIHAIFPWLGGGNKDNPISAAMGTASPEKTETQKATAAAAQPAQTITNNITNIGTSGDMSPFALGSLYVSGGF